jgi:hypothetical protein
MIYVGPPYKEGIRRGIFEIGEESVKRDELTRSEGRSGRGNCGLVP